MCVLRSLFVLHFSLFDFCKFLTVNGTGAIRILHTASVPGSSELLCTQRLRHCPTGKRGHTLPCPRTAQLEGLRRRTHSRGVGPSKRHPSFSCWLISAP